MIYVYGIDPYANSPSSMTLLKELLNAGFKKSEIKYAKTKEEIEENSYVMSFGAPAAKELTGIEGPLGSYAGSLCHMDTSVDVFVFPTYSPGYLFHNPNRKEEWKAQLELFCAFTRIMKGE